MWRLIGLVVLTRLAFGGQDPVAGRPWYHAQITWRAARRAGWRTRRWTDDDPQAQEDPEFVPWDDEAGDEEAVKATVPPPESAASALAWHADYVDSYLYNPMWWASGGTDRFLAALLHQHDLTALHFDDLPSTAHVAAMWARLEAGTRCGLLWAAERGPRGEGDVAAARNVLGVSLHALQDFYSHSNWVDASARRTQTWLQAGPVDGTGPDPRGAMDLYTGVYVSPRQHGRAEHGKFVFDCAVLDLLPHGVMSVLASPFSPLVDTPACVRWRECQISEPVRPETIAGVRVPPGVLYVNPPGIALDNPWLSEVGERQRDLDDRAALVDQARNAVDGPKTVGRLLFDAAYHLALEHSVAWLTTLGQEMRERGHGPFWDHVSRDDRIGQIRFPGPPVLDEYLGGYAADLVQYDSPSRVPFTFLSTGGYPPEPQDTGDDWFLRLTVHTSDDLLSGTDAHIAAVVDGGEPVALDRMGLREPEGGLGDWRLLERNDHETGGTDTYVLGPLSHCPQALTLTSSTAEPGDLPELLLADLRRAWEAARDWVKDLLMSAIGGHPDQIGDASRGLSWADVWSLVAGGVVEDELWLVGRGATKHAGAYAVAYSLRATLTSGGAMVRVTVSRFRCVRESDVDQFTRSDEPFFILMITSPAAPSEPADRRVRSSCSWPYGGVSAGHERELQFDEEVFVPTFGGVVFSVQAWESDQESPGDRQVLHRTFVRGFDESTVNERSAFLDAVGTLIAPSWKIGSLEAVAFRRSDRPEVVRLVQDRPLERWVAPNTDLPVPFDASFLPQSTGSPLVSGPIATGSEMRPGEVLYPGQSLRSPDGRFHLIYQWDGNLVLYGPSAALWSTQTGGRALGVTVMQTDGNLVIYGPGGTVVHDNRTWGEQNHGASLVVQDDGTIALRRPTGRLAWRAPRPVEDCMALAAQAAGLAADLADLQEQLRDAPTSGKSALSRAIRRVRAELASVDRRRDALGCPR